MRIAKNPVSGALSALLISFGLYGSAQAADISDCRAIQDRLARYACYDSWDTAAGTVSRPRSSAPAPAPQNARVETVVEEEESSFFGRIFNRDDDDPEPEEQAENQAEAVPESELDSFGRVSEANSASRVLEDSGGRSELIDTITAIEPRGPGMVRVTLASGQQWQQMYTKAYALRVGDEVRIYPTRWGSSYRLTVARLAGYIQVERVD